jgi:hypothetical protein
MMGVYDTVEFWAVVAVVLAYILQVERDHA